MRQVRTALGFVAAATLLWALPACNDDPFAITWRASPDTVLLYSLSRPELNLPSAFDFHPSRRRLVRVESPGATGNWDLALDMRGGELVFVPPGELGIDLRAAVATFPGLALEELEEAPSDSTSYTDAGPVAVEAGTAYVVRTRQRRDNFGRVCVHYAKMAPVEISLEAQTVRFAYDVNPKCNDLSLVPDLQ